MGNIKPWEGLTLQDDYMFKLVMRSKRICKTMIEKILRIVNSTGTVDDVAPDVKAFLDYINGVISDDVFVREINDEILRVKKIEAERVGYMTYEMKTEEERELAEAKGRKEGEGRLLKLFHFLLENGKQDEIKQATQNPESLPRLYSKYGIV